MEKERQSPEPLAKSRTIHVKYKYIFPIKPIEKAVKYKYIFPIKPIDVTISRVQKHKF